MFVFLDRETIAPYRRRSGLPIAPTNDVWPIIKFTSVLVYVTHQMWNRRKSEERE